MTLEDWLSQWLGCYCSPPIRAASTARGYRAAFAHLSPPLMATDVAELTPMAIQRDVYALAANYPRQAQILYAGLHAALARAVRLDLLATSPMAKVDKPTHQQRPIAYYDAAQLVALLRAARGSRCYGRLLLMSLCGLRIGEALAITPGEIDLDGLRVSSQLDARGHRCRLKSAASRRVVPLPPELRAMLAAPDALPSITRKMLYADLRGLCDAAQLPHIHPHGLRHTYAALAVQAGVTMRVLQSLMGHASYDVTATTYAHVGRSDTITAAVKIAAPVCALIGAEQLRMIAV